mmetsp:Transcript_21025/g.42635  ORF Transcript_21025/g.42635 Transcript_21025/m.42635 type:complete len:285 (-) Transcript_21025:1268-2122(-)
MAHRRLPTIVLAQRDKECREAGGSDARDLACFLESSRPRCPELLHLFVGKGAERGVIKVIRQPTSRTPLHTLDRAPLRLQHLCVLGRHLHRLPRHYVDKGDVGSPLARTGHGHRAATLAHALATALACGIRRRLSRRGHAYPSLYVAQLHAGEGKHLGGAARWASRHRGTNPSPRHSRHNRRVKRPFSPFDRGVLHFPRTEAGGRHNTRSRASLSEPCVGIVRAEQQAVLCARGEHAIRFHGAFTYQVIDEHPHVSLAPREHEGGVIGGEGCAASGVDAGNQAK